MDLIGNTRTDAGLRVQAELDTRKYPKGVTATDAEMGALSLHRNDLHGDWNYELRPRQVGTSISTSILTFSATMTFHLNLDEPISAQTRTQTLLHDIEVLNECLKRHRCRQAIRKAVSTEGLRHVPYSDARYGLRKSIAHQS